MNKYSQRIIWIHWVSSVLIIGLIITGVLAEEAPSLTEKFSLYQWHFPMGVAVFLLTILRIIAFFKDPRPTKLYPQGNKRQKLIDFVHKGFYWVILWMCLSGMISLGIENVYPAMAEGNPELLPDLTQDLSFILLSHHIVAKFVMLLLVMHLAGIFSHMLKTKENVFRRII